MLTINFYLLVADGTGSVHHLGVNDQDHILYKIAKKFHKRIEMQFDTYGRQGDEVSCTTESLFWLTEVLQTNVLEASIPDKNKEYDPGFIKGKTFIGPPEGYMHANKKRIPEEIMKNFIKREEKTLAEVIQSRTETCKYRNKNQSKMFTITTSDVVINTSLWKKSHEFKKIVDDQAPSILAKLHKLELRYQIDHRVQSMNLYIKDLKKMDYQEIVDCFCLYLDIEFQNFQRILVNNELENTIDFKQLLEKRDISVRLYTKQDLEYEVSLSDKELKNQFILHYQEKLEGKMSGKFTLFFYTASASLFDSGNFYGCYKSATLKECFTEALRDRSSTTAQVMQQLGWLSRKGILLSQNPVLNAAFLEAKKQANPVADSMYSKK